MTDTLTTERTIHPARNLLGTLRLPGDPGFPLRVSGEVYNSRGDVVERARVDLWLTDHVGRYDGKWLAAASGDKTVRLWPVR